MGALKLTYRSESPTLKVVWNSLKDKENTCTGAYRYGFQGMEKVDEINGVSGSHYTAKFWEYDARLGRRWNVDPVVKYDQSGYSAFANNPIWFIDPSGADTVEVFKETGKLNSHIETDKGKDVFFMVDKDGNRLKDQNISFDEGTLTGINQPKVKTSKGDKNLTLFNMSGDENAEKLFEFLADPKNTKVEWTHAKIGTEKSGSNIVGSSHDKSSTPVGHYLRLTKYTLREVNHNHPSGNFLPSNADKNGAKLYKATNKDVILNIYTHPNSYSEYDEKGTLDFSKFSLPAVEIKATKKK